jgi:hypothetical protein
MTSFQGCPAYYRSATLSYARGGSGRGKATNLGPTEELRKRSPLTRLIQSLHKLRSSVSTAYYTHLQTTPIQLYNTISYSKHHKPDMSPFVACRLLRPTSNTTCPVAVSIVCVYLYQLNPIYTQSILLPRFHVFRASTVTFYFQRHPSYDERSMHSTFSVIVADV